MVRLGILGSTRGTHLQSIIDAIAAERLAAKIEIVISNKKDALILERARSHQLNAIYAPPTDLTREAFDQHLTFLLQQSGVELIVLIGYMRILSADFVHTWQNKIINIHPSLLPAFAGKMDLGVHEAVLAAGVKETGCTVHYVTETVDAGPIILQKRCAVYDNDTPELLKSRVQLLEGEALVEAIRVMAQGNLR